MEPLTLLIGAGIVGVVSAIGSVVNDAQANEREKRQAAVIQGNVDKLQSMMSAGQIEESQALSRIEQMFKNVTPKLRAAMETQVNIASDEITKGFQRSLDDLKYNLEQTKGDLTEQRQELRDQFIKAIDRYSKDVDKSRKAVRQSFTQQRMGASGGLAAAVGKLQEQQGKTMGEFATQEAKVENQFYKQIGRLEQDYNRQVSTMTDVTTEKLANLRLQAGSQLEQMMANMEMQAFQQSEATRQGFRQERLGMQSQQIGLETQKGMLEAQQRDAGTMFGNAFGSFLQGAAPMAGQAVGQGLAGAFKYGQTTEGGGGGGAALGAGGGGLAGGGLDYASGEAFNRQYLPESFYNTIYRQ